MFHRAEMGDQILVVKHEVEKCLIGVKVGVIDASVESEKER